MAELWTIVRLDGLAGTTIAELGRRIVGVVELCAFEIPKVLTLSHGRSQAKLAF